MATNTLKSSLMEILQPLFAEAVKVLPVGSSIPAVVLENRKDRALGRIVAALESRGSASLPRELRAEVGDLLISWSEALFDDGFKAVESFEVRCANERDLVLARESGDPQLILAALERDLRRRILEQFGRIEIRGIQTSERVLLDLDRIYIPSYVEAPLLSGGSKPEWIAVPYQRVPVIQVMKHQSRLLIVGQPGSGKSTLVAWLAVQLCGSGLATEAGWPKDVVPLVLTARELESPGFWNSWVDKIARLTSTEPEAIEHVLTGGRAVLLVDGLDEVPGEFGYEVRESLWQFCENHPSVPVIATSRPTVAVSSSEATVPGFGLARLSALTWEEADEFVDKWCLAAEESSNRDPLEAKAKAAEAAKDLKQRIARSRPLQRLVETPLNASIVCMVHRTLGQQLPEQRVALYEKCTDVLLYEWDKAMLPADSLLGGLTAPRKRTLLAGLARTMHEARQTEWPEQKVCSHFAERLPEFGYRDADAPRVVTEIRERNRLLLERRPGYFSFSHLTFQEYLTALDVAQRPPMGLDLLLEKHYRDPWWQDVIVLVAGMPGVDAGKLIAGLLENGPPWDFLAARCLETAIEVPLSVRKRMEESISSRLPPQSYEGAVHLAEWGIMVAPILCRILASREVSPEEAVNSLHLLGLYRHEPAITTLVQFVEDKRIPAREYSSVGDIAIRILTGWATNSAIAKRALLTEIRHLPEQRLEVVRASLAEFTNLAKTTTRKSVILKDQISQADLILEAINEHLKDLSSDKRRSKRGVRSG